MKSELSVIFHVVEEKSSNLVGEDSRADNCPHKIEQLRLTTADLIHAFDFRELQCSMNLLESLQLHTLLPSVAVD